MANTSPPPIKPGALALLALGTAGLAACNSYVVSIDAPRRSSVAGVGFIETGRGEVKYPVEGWSVIVSGRRRSALRRIAKTCSGMEYKIVKEFVSEDSEVPYSQADLKDTVSRGLKHYQVSPFLHILFECAPTP